MYFTVFYYLSSVIITIYKFLMQIPKNIVSIGPGKSLTIVGVLAF